MADKSNLRSIYSNNIKTISFRIKNTNIKEKQKNFKIYCHTTTDHRKIINLILFINILFLLPIIVLCKNEYNVEIKVNKEGYNQVLSDEFNGVLPSKIFVNENSFFLNKKSVYIRSKNYKIKLQWTSTLSNFSYMFSNLTNIISIKMNYLFGNNCNMSYMFYNCNNLKNFTYSSYNNISYLIKDMRFMFYNCKSLENINFHDLYINYYDFVINSYNYILNILNNITYTRKETVYYYYEVNISYMFYNCTNLNSVTFDNDMKYINDMRSMFYNCFSLTRVNLQRIQTDSNIDISFMFYNCYQLESYSINSINVNDIKLMFYNCSSIKEINLNNFNVSSNYINISRLFYNCKNLTNIIGNFRRFYVSDIKEMFYNCTSLESIKFDPYKINGNCMNMSMIFYNCFNIKSITFDICHNYDNNVLYPIDLSFAFLNCNSLKSLYFKCFNTDYLKEIKYMLYDCRKLEIFDIQNSYFNNPLIKNMRGIFQNCESLISLNLTSFYTPNVEIMWDMFKGCSSLKSINLSNFNTAKVTDMESMFEGCSSLTTLTLDNFDTNKVHYMNKMFKDCTKLETLNFKYISSESLGTMYQMFYNCNKLTSLNIFSLTEKAQTITELFEGISSNLMICIKDHENIPNIFKEMLKRTNIFRDCSSNCYGDKKAIIREKKICCPNFAFNDNCYEKCPGRTRNYIGNKICRNFSCDTYYNYEQNDCLNTNVIPDGYYLNDTTLKTIDKCDANCKTCNETATNCLSCKEKLPYIYLGHCSDSCEYGYYNDAGITKCKYFSEECSEIKEESFKKGLCVECASGYYTKNDDIAYDKNYKKCYKDPPNYYLDEEDKIYKRCFHSCEYCYGKGEESFHNCKECNINNDFQIPITKKGLGYQSINCYKKCLFNFYMENENYTCTDDMECPSPYILYAEEIGQCAVSCNETFGYYKKFRNNCYKDCPTNISKDGEDNPYLCKPICPHDFPFEMVKTQTCVTKCSIIEWRDKLCILNNKSNRTELEIQDLLLQNFHDDLINSFNYSLISDEENIIIYENITTYEILSSKNKKKNNKTSSLSIGKCEYTLKKFYDIKENETLYIFKIDANIKGKTGPTVLYELFYTFPGTNRAVELDLSLCDGNSINIFYSIELENPELYNKDNSLYNDICFYYTSNEGADMSLDDRQKEYTDNNKSLCEENCEYLGYDETNKQVECNCEIKINIPLISEIKIDKNKLYKFMDIKTITNFEFLRCIQSLFSIEGLKKNIGFYIFIPSFIMYFVCIFIFYKKEFPIIKDQINDLVYAKKNAKYLKNENKNKNENINDNIKKDKYVKPLFMRILEMKNYKVTSRNEKINNINRINQENSTKSKLYTTIKKKSTKNNNLKDEDIQSKSSSNYIKTKKELIEAPPIKNLFNQNINNEKTRNTKHTDFNKSSIKKILKINKNREDIEVGLLTEEEKQKIQQILIHNDQELNELTYKEALKYDKRTYIQYFFSLLKIEHLLFKIFNKNDYNSRIMKIYLCFYNFDLSYIINALFFNDNTLHKIYLDGGKFNFIYQLPQIIYSTIISIIFETILSTLALSGKAILEYKKKKIKRNIVQEAQDVLKVLNFKFIIFFIFTFLSLIFFWYYISCFCAVYKNTQYHLIKDTLFSFGSSMLSQFAMKLLPGIFRIPALKHRKPYLFTISQLLQMIS